MGQVQPLAAGGSAVVGNTTIQQVQSNAICDEALCNVTQSHQTKGGGYLEVLFNAKLDHLMTKSGRYRCYDTCGIFNDY